MQLTFNLVADTICRTAELGLTITDAADAGEFTVINACPVEVCDKCPGCGHTGRLRDHVVRRLTDLPVVVFPTRLHVRVPRFQCLNQGYSQRIYQGRTSLRGTRTHRHLPGDPLDFTTPGDRQDECGRHLQSTRSRVGHGQ